MKQYLCGTEKIGRNIAYSYFMQAGTKKSRFIYRVRYLKLQREVKKQ